MSMTRSCFPAREQIEQVSERSQLVSLFSLLLFCFLCPAHSNRGESSFPSPCSMKDAVILILHIHKGWAQVGIWAVVNSEGSKCDCCNFVSVHCSKHAITEYSLLRFWKGYGPSKSVQRGNTSLLIDTYGYVGIWQWLWTGNSNHIISYIGP